MLILSLTSQSLFKEFATKTQLGHIHCCSFATQFHEMQLNTHTLQSLPRKGLSCLQELPCPFSFPGSSLVPPLKINRWRGCLRSHWKSCEMAKAITRYLQQIKLAVPLATKSCTRTSYICSLAYFAESTYGCSSSLLAAGHTGTQCSDFR